MGRWEEKEVHKKGVHGHRKDGWERKEGGSLLEICEEGESKGHSDGLQGGV